jgi:tryptophan-rich sensory protein
MSSFIRSPSRLIIAILLCNLIGGLGAIFTVTGSGSWYAGLTKSALNPPNWVFGPAWTVLFILMGIALYFVWVEGTEKKKVQVALAAFFVQLGLNLLWSYLFFGLQSPFLGFMEILLLWIAICMTIITFYKVRREAAVLLIPYLLWVSFATYLTYQVMVLNG